MAARRQRRDAPTDVEGGDEDVLDPVESDDDELDEDDLDELEDDFDDEASDEDETDDADEAEAEDGIEVPLEEGLDADEEDVPAVVGAVPAEAAFDDEDEARVVAAVVSDDDDDGAEIDGLREEEFVCRSCYMAKRDSQLADPERMLCRDCA